MEISLRNMVEDGFVKALDENYGLYNGKMMHCIWSFYVSRKNDNREKLKEAHQLLDEIAENICSIDGYDYATGLAGIGFSIEWLAQHNYIDGDTDDILGDIDDEIYKSVVYSKSSNHSLLEGTTGKAYYFYKRLMSSNSGKSRYKQICLIECLILLSDELVEYLLNEEDGLCNSSDLNNLTDQDTINICSILILFEKILKKRINVEAVKSGICGISSFIERVCLMTSTGDLPLRALPLVYGHKITGELLGDPVWREKTISMKKRLPSVVDSAHTPDIFAYMFGHFSRSSNDDVVDLTIPDTPLCLTNLLKANDGGLKEFLLLN